jgi:benzodiazapine receptor
MKWPKFIVSILICQLAGIIGSVFTVSSIPDWYEGLNKPWFTPPNWLFGPVWITLYTLMGISLYVIWNKGLDNKDVRSAIAVFGLQLGLNSAWSIIFFGFQNIFAALLEIVVLWIAILVTIIKFYRIDKKAGLLIIPYIIWVTIATLLNYFVWILN